MPKQVWNARAVISLGNSDDFSSEEPCNMWLRGIDLEADGVEDLKKQLFSWIKGEMSRLVDQNDHEERIWGFVKVVPVTKSDSGEKTPEQFSLGVSGFWLKVLSRGHKDHRKFLLWEFGLGPNPKNKTLVK